MHHDGIAMGLSPPRDGAAKTVIPRAGAVAVMAVLLVGVTLASLARPAAAEGDYCAALPPEAGILEEDPGVRCLGQFPNPGGEPILVEIVEVGSAEAADARSRTLVDDLAEPSGCTPYEFTDGTLTEAFDCVTALSVLEAGSVVVSATLAVPAGTLDGQPFWSLTTGAVRLVGNRLGLAEAGTADDTGESDESSPPPADRVAGSAGSSDDGGSIDTGVVVGAAAGAAVITGVLVGRSARRRRRKRDRPTDATPDPCAELGDVGDAINSDFRALEPLRAELFDTWNSWHELLWDEADLVAEINRVQDELAWWGGANTAATAGGGAADVGATVADAMGDGTSVFDGMSSAARRATTKAARVRRGPPLGLPTARAPRAGGTAARVGTVLTGVAAGAAVYGEHVESSRQAAMERLGALRTRVEVLESRKSDLASQAQDLQDEFARRVDDLRHRALAYRDAHRSLGCAAPPIHLDRLDQNWFDSYQPPRPPVAEPAADRPRPTEVDCTAFSDALATYTRERDRIQAALESSDGNETASIAGRLLVLDRFEGRVAGYRAEVEQTIGDVRMSRARWSSHSLALGLVAALPMAATLGVGAGLLVVFGGCMAGLRADQISPTDADLMLVGRLREIESHIADLRRQLRARQVQLATTADSSLGSLEEEHARLRRAATRCGTDAAIPEPPEVPTPRGGAEATRATEIIRHVTAEASGVATNGDLDRAVWIDLMLKETSRW